MVNRLTVGTVTMLTSIANTPISGAFETAAEKPELTVIITVGIATVSIESSIATQTAVRVTFFEKSPQRYGPIKQPATTPQEKLIILTITEMLAVAKIKDSVTNKRQRSLVTLICFLP